MNKSLQNTTLSIAIAFSVLAHATLLAIQFTAPDTFKFQPTDPGLEVILVNAKHDKKPLKAEALAQANLDGGGDADAGHAKSPLPDMRKTEDGESIKASKRRIEELEQLEKKLLDQMLKPTPMKLPTSLNQVKPEHVPNVSGTDILDSSKAIARREAEITERIEDANKRPRKTYITPSTLGVGYAMYYQTMKKRIETLGTLNFPMQNGAKLYGELTVSIPIFQDGSIYEKEGGPHVERSSGNPVLDRAALNIVRRSAPFGKFPSTMRSTDKDDQWIVIVRFKFTREEKMETDLRGGPNQ